MHNSLVFPGQGSQKVGMGKDLFEKYRTARDIFNIIDDSLSQKLSKLMFEGPLEELTKTENAQPAIMATSVAIMEVLKNDFGFNTNKIKYCAGHSLGEYTALAVTNCLKLKDVAKLLKLRGISMQNAVPEGKGAMVALIGVDINEVNSLLNFIPENYICEIANHNTQNQVVLSGDSKAIDLIAASAKEKKIKAIKLAVSAPFHCAFMKDTAKKLKSTFEDISFKSPNIPIICNFTASPIIDVDNLKEALVKQTFSTVRWHESIKYMLANNVSNFIEIGYGSTLANMIKRTETDKDFETISISNSNDIENYLGKQ